MSDLTPLQQARFHLGCARRHGQRALRALWWYPWFRLLALLSALALLALLTGCGTPGKPNRWVPWNWFKPDAAARVEKFDTKIDAAELDLLRLSQQLYLAAQRELEADPTPSVYLKRALGYHHRASENLASAVGPIAPAQARAVESMVAQRQSADPAAQAQGEVALQSIDRQSGFLASRLARLKAERDEAVGKLETAYASARVAQQKWDRMWFYIWAVVGGYVFVTIVLPILSRAFPALRGVSMVAQGIVTPFVTAAAHKAQKTLGDVVGGLEELRTRMKVTGQVTKAEADEILRGWVTEADGTAAHVDEVRRETKLV